MAIARRGLKVSVKHQCKMCVLLEYLLPRPMIMSIDYCKNLAV